MRNDFLVSIRVKSVKVVSFSESDATHWEKWAQEFPELAATFGRHDVVCFVSRVRDQQYFSHGWQWMDGVNPGEKVRVLRTTERMRIDGGRWEPKMLGNYAHMAGFRIVGQQLYQDELRKADEEKERLLEARRREERRSAA